MSTLDQVNIQVNAADHTVSDLRRDSRILMGLATFCEMHNAQTISEAEETSGLSVLKWLNDSGIELG
jgi:hypothetical protein